MGVQHTFGDYLNPLTQFDQEHNELSYLQYGTSAHIFFLYVLSFQLKSFNILGNAKLALI